MTESFSIAAAKKEEGWMPLLASIPLGLLLFPKTCFAVWRNILFSEIRWKRGGRCLLRK